MYLRQNSVAQTVPQGNWHSTIALLQFFFLPLQGPYSPHWASQHGSPRGREGCMHKCMWWHSRLNPQPNNGHITKNPRLYTKFVSQIKTKLIYLQKWNLQSTSNIPRMAYSVNLQEIGRSERNQGQKKFRIVNTVLRIFRYHHKHDPMRIHLKLGKVSHTVSTPQ